MPAVIEQNQQPIVRRWLEAVKQDADIDGIPLSEAERQDHIPQLLQVALAKMRGD